MRHVIFILEAEEQICSKSSLTCMFRVKRSEQDQPADIMLVTDGEEDYDDLREAVRCVKEVIAAVDGKVNEHDKRRRLKDFHGRTDSKSIMMMKSGQMFAREDLLRRRLIHDGALQLKNSQGRLKGEEMLTSSVFLLS